MQTNTTDKIHFPNLVFLLKLNYLSSKLIHELVVLLSFEPNSLISYLIFVEVSVGHVFGFTVGEIVLSMTI